MPALFTLPCKTLVFFHQTNTNSTKTNKRNVPNYMHTAMFFLFSNANLCYLIFFIQTWINLQADYVLRLNVEKVYRYMIWQDDRHEASAASSKTIRIPSTEQVRSLPAKRLFLPTRGTAATDITCTWVISYRRYRPREPYRIVENKHSNEVPCVN